SQSYAYTHARRARQRHPDGTGPGCCNGRCQVSWSAQSSLFALLPQEAPQAAPELSLRPYQSEARKAVLEAHSRLRGALVVLPTGTGKTRTAGGVIWDYKLAGQKTLVLCPTITLV